MSRVPVPAIDARHEWFARAWAKAIAGTSYVPMGPAEVEAYLGRLTERLVAALHTIAASASRPSGHDRAGGNGAGAHDEFGRGTSIAEEVGASLVESHFISPEALGGTVTLIGTHLGACAGLSGVGDQVAVVQVAAVQGALSAGYARAMRRRMLDEQELARTAMATAQAQIESRLRVVFSEAAIGIAVSDVTGRIVDANQTLLDTLGYTADEFYQLNFRQLAHPDDTPEIWSSYEAMLRGDRDHIRRDKRFFRRDGTAVHTDMVQSLLRDPVGRPQYTVSMIQDVTDRHRLHARLRYQALHDPLTGLANRRLLFDRMNEVFDPAGPGGRVGLCYLDLDGFKAYNDTLGHELGDRLLVAVADRLDQALSGPGRLVARAGGDEFIVLVAHSSGTEELVDVANAALAALEAPVRVEDHELTISASVGVVERPVIGSGVEDMMKAADTTLSWAKADGKRRWAMFDAERHEREVARFRLAATMPGALERGEFRLDYQPLVRLGDGALVGVEALVRWQHPTFGLLAPDSFISVAEEIGEIVAIGRWVLRQACEQARTWQDELGGVAPFVSVNLAVQQVKDPGLVGDVIETLAQTGLDARLLQLELTESAFMAKDGAPLEALRSLAATGARIAIDDFGTGYSNLAYLCDLPVHALKLAGPFMAGLDGARGVDPAKERIVAALIRLAHGLGLVATAEGVETREQAERLRELHCDTGQGWHFARPGPPEEIVRRVHAHGGHVYSG